MTEFRRGDYITVQEAAHILQITEQSVHQLMSRGHIRNWREHNRFPRPLRADVEAWAAPDTRLTVAEVAERLGVSEQAVRNYIKKGYLVGAQRGRRGEFRFTEDALKRFIPPATGKRTRQQPIRRMDGKR